MQPMQEPVKIRGMFAAIAGTYDVLNHVLSLNQDRAWRTFAVEKAEVRTGDTVLDVCCGTGDLSLELSKKVGPAGTAIGTDFCEAMVAIGRKKADELADPVRLGVADTLQLPFRDSMFRAVTVGFGIRNVADLQAGIREMARVTQPGGKVAILEFTQPANPLFRFVYYVYFLILLPILLFWIGAATARMLAGDPSIRTANIFKAFAYSLIPIALFYHLAHNCMHFFMEGQVIIPHLSDPFGWGWNLFGTAGKNYPPFLSLTTIWWLQVIFVVIGHLYGVVLADRYARTLFKNKRAIFLSLIPLLITMILYSAFSMWLIMQPMDMRSGM